MEKKREPIKDVAFLIDFLRDLAVSEEMAIFEDCADALEREHEKHLGECVQIAQYSDELRGQKWIPVKERLPKKYEYVLVHSDPGIVTVSCWVREERGILAWGDNPDDGLWFREKDCDSMYWMPLPKGPKED